MLFNDLRDYVDHVDGLGELRRFEGAHWDLEIGAITEVLAEQKGPMALFDRTLEATDAAMAEVARRFG